MATEKIETTTSQSSSSESAITLESVRKTFEGGNIIACEDINLDINSDEFVVLVGPSGCGKTTTLRCIAGLEQPDGGTITIRERDVTNVQPKDRDLAFVFQSITLFPHMTVRENIRFGLDMKTELPPDEKEQRVQQAAEKLGLSDYLDRKPSALSGGQQQRVSIGRAMVMDPAAFLLDEPFTALDRNLRDQMQTEVKKLQRDLETAMVFVTHDQEEAMTLGDKIVIMNDGHIQQVGTPHEIYHDPANEFVAQFIGSPQTNMIDCTITEQGNTTTIETDIFSVQLPDHELESHIGGSGRVAIRPENLYMDGESRFQAAVDVIEPQGSRDHVFLNADGQSIRLVTEGGVLTDEENEVSLGFDIDDIWVFGSDGERLV